MEKKNQIACLEDKVGALKSMLKDLQIQFAKQNPLPSEENMGIDLKHPVVLED